MAEELGKLLTDADGSLDANPVNLDASGPPEDLTGLDTTCLDSIDPEPIRWLVPGYLPLGKLVLLAGDGGHGKSFTTLHIAAAITTGKPCFGLVYPAPEPANVLLISCEDDFGDTVVPRLLAAGADLKRVHRVNGIKLQGHRVGPFSLNHYDRLTEELAAHPEIRVVIIDPAGAYIGSTGIDDHKDSDLRSLLSPLSALAAKHRVTIVLVKHLNKGVSAKAVQKVSGSVGYVNAVRAAFLIAPDPDDSDEEKKLFLSLKVNITKKPSGLRFHIAQLEVPEQNAILDRFPAIVGEDRVQLAAQLYRVEWDGPTTMTADKAVSGDTAKADKPSKVKDCIDWLITFLGDHAWPDAEVIQAGEDSGFGLGIVKQAKTRARKENNLNSRAAGPGGVWWNWIGSMRRPDRPRPYIPKMGKRSDDDDADDTLSEPAPLFDSSLPIPD